MKVIEINADYLSRYENINSSDYPEINFKDYSMLSGHLNMIKDFYYNSLNEFGIFCEDDIFIHKNLINLLPDIIKDFNLLHL